MSLSRLIRDNQGAVLVEATIMMTLVFTLVLGSIDFLFAFYQWNAAAKAVQVGTRIAAVSDPVATGLNRLSTGIVNAAVSPGGAMPRFTIRCESKSQTCTCRGSCVGVAGYNVGAMNTIIYGRGSSSCADAKTLSSAGMCDIFPRIANANVIVTYTQTGRGYAGRPGGPVPTITLSLHDLPFHFFFLGSITGFRDIQIPALRTSITAEDLSSHAPLF